MDFRPLKRLRPFMDDAFVSAGVKSDIGGRADERPVLDSFCAAL